MKGKKILFAGIFALTILPFMTHANRAVLTMENHTDSYGTASVSILPCSSSIGDGGIIKPHGTLTIDQSYLSNFCSLMSCEGHIYASNNCSGKEVAKVTVTSKGITSIKNYSTDFVVSGSGLYGAMDKPNNWTNWFKSLFMR